MIDGLYEDDDLVKKAHEFDPVQNFGPEEGSEFFNYILTVKRAHNV